LAALLFLRDLLEVLVHNAHGEHNTGAGGHRCEQVSKDTSSTDEHAAENGGRSDVAPQGLGEGFVTLSLNGHILLGKTARHVFRRLTRDVSPKAGKFGANSHHEHSIDNKAVELPNAELIRWGQVVSKSTVGSELGVSVSLMPTAEHRNDKVPFEVKLQNLRNEEDNLNNSAHHQN
jgi:hypothetical protein